VTGGRPFHYSFFVRDLDATRRFYGDLLGCAEGRSAPTWVDFDFFGHQLVVHLDHSGAARRPQYNAVDGKDVPVPHFGMVLQWQQWHDLADRLRAAGTRFGIEPGTRFKGQVGEQATMFLQDPSGNALEFKTFRDLSLLFAK